MNKRILFQTPREEVVLTYYFKRGNLVERSRADSCVDDSLDVRVSLQPQVNAQAQEQPSAESTAELSGTVSSHASRERTGCYNRNINGRKLSGKCSVNSFMLFKGEAFF